MNEEPKTTMGEWPRPEEVMPPRPTQEQDALWDYLDTVFDEDTLNRESKFINLDEFNFCISIIGGSNKILFIS